MAAFVTGLQEGSHDSPKHEMVWYPIVISLGVGIAILGLWSMLLARRQVPELTAGLASMRFHLTAEILTGALLIIAGVASRAGVAWAPPVAAAALGAALYSTINSPGYYADRGEKALVVMFAVLAVLIAGAIVVVAMT